MTAETQAGVVHPGVVLPLVSYFIVSSNANGVVRVNSGYDYPNSTENYDVASKRITDHGGEVLYRKNEMSKILKDTLVALLRPLEFLSFADVRPSLDLALESIGEQ